jgi:hypothetical protein
MAEQIIGRQSLDGRGDLRYHFLPGMAAVDPLGPSYDHGHALPSSHGERTP